ncbi:beta-microseminoprotein-like isoform X2 [Dendropsophus ebraccatus]|uniref:beta-microseminoprotein-like isoform X1 n=1 Tax=Dendropsophus ebraccatus TaxID=150705 RepID=UPI00383112D1
MMKFLVALAFGAGILVVACNAFCFNGLSKGVHGEEPAGCYYRKRIYPPNSQWRTKDCLNCTCGSSGRFECCSAYGKPVNYDKETCKFVFDKKECVYKLIPNEDPTKQCQSYGMVG